MINDEKGFLVTLVGTLIILWSKPIADPIASMVGATIIAYNGIKLFRENLSFLLGRSPGPEYLAWFEKLALSAPAFWVSMTCRMSTLGQRLSMLDALRRTSRDAH